MNATRPSRRRPINLTVPEDLADAARALGVNASQAAEAGIAEAVRRARGGLARGEPSRHRRACGLARPARHAAGASLAGLMARFDVHRCRRVGVPYLVDNQADFLGNLPTRLVIPLLPADAIPSPIERLHLRVTVDGGELVLATNLMASVRRDQLGPKVGSVADRRSEIVAAVDFLQHGF